MCNGDGASLDNPYQEDLELGGLVLRVLEDLLSRKTLASVAALVAVQTAAEESGLGEDDKKLIALWVEDIRAGRLPY